MADERARPDPGLRRFGTARPRRWKMFRDRGPRPVREGLIVRWIGASRRRRKEPPEAPTPDEGARANVIVLADARPHVLVRRPVRPAAPSARTVVATLLPFVRPGLARPICRA